MKYPLFAILITMSAVARGATPATTQAAAPSMPATFTLNLWATDPPNVVPATRPERDDGSGRIWDVNVPGVLVYLPRKNEPAPPRTAIIVCPGGAYTHLTRLVGADGAVNAFVPRGIAVIALKYRTTPPSKTVDADALLDAKRAVRLIRAHATEWNIDPRKIGLLGWSAGGNLGLNIATHFDSGDAAASDPVEQQSCRPDFVALMSPWPNKREMSAFPVSKDAPPAFVCSARDDRTAPVTFAEAIAVAYQQAGAKADLWVVETGGHGAFTIDAPGEGGAWVARFIPWLRQNGFLAH